MRKIVLLMLMFCLWTAIKAQSYTLNGTVASLNDASPGCLSKGIIPDKDIPSIVELTITGAIDATDFRMIREKLTALTKLNLSGLTIVGYSGTEGTITGTNMTYDANVFPMHALEGRSTITTVIFPTSKMTKIDRFAFYGTGIISVTSLPSSLLSIEEGAFAECPNLSKVILPSSLKTIGPKSFSQEPLLLSIFIPSSVNYLGESAFESCTKLLDVYMESTDPNNITSFSSTFNDPKIKTLHVPLETSSSYSKMSNWNSFSKIIEGIKLPTVVTAKISSVSTNSAMINCELTDVGDTNPVYYGIVWCSSGTPTVDLGTKTEDGTTSSTLTFDSKAGNLNAGTTYSVRAYATNSAGTAYGSTLTFTTPSLTVKIVGTTATVTGAFAGCLTTDPLISANKATLTSLTVSGTLDASDFKVIRDNMTALTNIDLTNVSIAAYTGTAGTITPIANYSYPVNELPVFAFASKTNVVTIYPPTSLVSIGANAISGCSRIQYFSIPTSVKTINKNAFASCINLYSITIPSSVTEIQKATFSGCSNLYSVSIPSSVTLIDSMAFYSCNNLSSISIPSSVKTIGYYAFAYCKILASIAIPSSVTAIGAGAFDRCSLLKTVSLPSSISRIEANTFSSCTSLSSITIPSSVTYIGEQAFTHAGLTSITLPSSVTDMGGSAFNGCNALTSVTLSPSIKKIEAITFGFCSQLTSITIPSSVISIGDDAFSYCSKLASVTIPSSVISIGQRAFYYCTALTGITIPSSVTSIGNVAFSGCSALTAITIPSSVTSIGSSAFSNCSKLTSFTIPSSVTSIEDGVFLGCTALTAITIPSSVKSIGQTAFGTCIALATITIPSSVTSIKKTAFYNCTALTAITIPSSVTSIEDYTFYNCTALTAISIPSLVTSIGSSAFYNCTKLASVTIPSSVTTVGSSAFASCTQLATIKAYPSVPVSLYSSSNVFNNVPGTCILRIPSGSLSHYKDSAQWNAFTNIVEGFVSPSVKTQAATNVAATTATGNATVTDLGDVKPVKYGLVWNTSSGPTIDLTTKTELTTPTTDPFTSTITNLTPNTTYYARAYATNTASTPAAGTVYGEEVSFTTTNKVQLTVSTPPSIANKIYDGLTTATFTDIGILSGITNTDLANVSIVPTATFDDEKIGTGKAVMVHYALGGTAANNYIAPADYKLTGEIDKGLTLNVLLEGLWNTSSLKMNKCRDWDDSKKTFVDKFTNDIAAQVTVELHSSPYSKLEYTFEGLNLHQNGAVTSEGLSAVAIPPAVADNYYLTVKSRNHLPAVSASMISFSGNSSSYDFTDKDGKAYVSDLSATPTKKIGDVWTLYAGNVNDEDPRYQEININDLYTVFNNRSSMTKSYGYSVYDLDGNGDVDLNDVYMLFNNRDLILYIP